MKIVVENTDFSSPLSANAIRRQMISGEPSLNFGHC